MATIVKKGFNGISFIEKKCHIKYSTLEKLSENMLSFYKVRETIIFFTVEFNRFS
jgi:hypothetical protein